MQYPSLELELTVETTPVLIDLTRRGALDLAFAALPASGDGIRTSAFPAMEMCFVGSKSLHRKRQYALDELAANDLLTFQRGSQPHVGLLDLLKAKNQPYTRSRRSRRCCSSYRVDSVSQPCRRLQS